MDSKETTSGSGASAKKDKKKNKARDKKERAKSAKDTDSDSPQNSGDARKCSASNPVNPQNVSKHSNNGKRDSHMKKNPIFQPYMCRENVQAGLKRGYLIQGELRINPRAWEEGYVPHPDGKSDVYLDGLPARNRALNSDQVVVRLHQRSEWRVMQEQLKRAETAGQVQPSTALPHDNLQNDSGDDDVIVEGETLQMVDQFGKLTIIDSQKPDMTSLPATPDRPRDSGSSQSSTPQRPNAGVTSQPSTPQRPLPDSNVRDGTPQRPEKKKYNALTLREYGQELDDRFLQKTGEVVYIVEKCHSRASAGVLKLMPDKNPKMALFVPTDSRVPRICIPMKECPEDFRKKPDTYASTLMVARITNWDEFNKMPMGNLVRSLGEIGDIETETEGVLMAYEVDFSEFDQKVLDCLPETPWSIPETEVQNRTDLRHLCIFTIDPATARDLDDALSCRKLENGLYEVGVHIADVSYFLEESSKLDKVAAQRCTSVYLIQKVIPMLPRLLCEQLCSLNPDSDKLTFSVIWKLNEDGDVIDDWFGRTIIKSRVKLSYQHAQQFIDDPTSEWTDDLPQLDDTQTKNDVKDAILILHKMAVKLRKARFDAGALRLEQPKLAFSINRETGLPSGCSVYEYKDSNKLIEEFMLLANMAVAHKIYDSYPNSALLRRHPEPQEKMMDDLVDFCKALGVDIKDGSSTELQKTLIREFGDGGEAALARYHVLTQLCTKPMQTAKYFCTGSIDDGALYRHYALNVPLYTHFTSPIRRYADVIVHRQLAAALKIAPEMKWGDVQIQNQANRCNLKKTNSKRVQEFSQDLFLSVFVKECGPLVRDGMVMIVLDRSFDVLIPSLGVVKRVYCEKLEGLKSMEFRKKCDKVPEMTLIWDDNGNDLKQEIEIFTRVRCVMASDKQPMKWSMVITPELLND